MIQLIQRRGGRGPVEIEASTFADAVRQAAESKESLDRVIIHNRDLLGLNLNWARLRYADFIGCNFSNTQFHGALLPLTTFKDCNMTTCDLSDSHGSLANFIDCDMRYSSLVDSSFVRGRFVGCDLMHANFFLANVQCAEVRNCKNIPQSLVFATSIVPEAGSFLGYKKAAFGQIVVLRIPEWAARSNGTGRKCRSEAVEVLEIRSTDPASAGKRCISHYDGDVEYKVGAIVRSYGFTRNRWIECAKGIHFFLTEKEAQYYHFH